MLINFILQNKRLLRAIHLHVLRPQENQGTCIMYPLPLSTCVHVRLIPASPLWTSTCIRR